jgi:hypothetical protein
MRSGPSFGPYSSKEGQDVSDQPAAGPPRIHGELPESGIDLSGMTAATYMFHHPKPPSPSWRTFLVAITGGGSAGVAPQSPHHHEKKRRHGEP